MSLKLPILGVVSFLLTTSGNPVTTPDASGEECLCLKSECLSDQTKVPINGSCCAVCMDCTIDGRPYSRGDHVPPPNPCYTHCKCLKSGKLRCTIDQCSKEEQCASGMGPATAKGECCRRCPRQNEYVIDGHIYSYSDPSDGPPGCDPCIKEQCASGVEPAAAEGDCCPRCPRQRECVNGGRIYANSDQFDGPSGCCHCANGRIACSNITCEWK